VAFEEAAKAAERQQLLVGDRARRLEQRVQQRRSVALREDQPIVRRVAGVEEVVAKVLGQKHGHEVGRRQRRRRVTRVRRTAGANGVEPELSRKPLKGAEVSHDSDLSARDGLEPLRLVA
jgi:hypothetical protein